MNRMDQVKRIVVGVSGSSGAALGLECLKCLHTLGVKTSLVASHAAELTIEHELNLSLTQFSCYADEVFSCDDLGATLASGTYHTDGMIVAPCSMKTLAGVACGFSNSLLLRAADVTIKEQRPLVLMARETPMSSIHLENMLKLSRIPQVVVMPPLLTFYNKPLTIDQMVHHIVCKALTMFQLDCPGFNRWE